MVKRKMLFVVIIIYHDFGNVSVSMPNFGEHNNMLRLTTSYISMCFLTTGEIYCNRFIWAGMEGSVLEFGVGRDPLTVAIKQD